MAEVETLLHSVSHDLRAPLRQLIGFSRMLIDDHGRDIDPAALHYAERIHQAADQMATLVDDLVGLSRIGRLKGQENDGNSKDGKDQSRHNIASPRL